jgi:hypothetical protein
MCKFLLSNSSSRLMVVHNTWCYIWLRNLKTSMSIISVLIVSLLTMHAHLIFVVSCIFI